MYCTLAQFGDTCTEVFSFYATLHSAAEGTAGLNQLAGYEVVATIIKCCLTIMPINNNVIMSSSSSAFVNALLVIVFLHRCTL